VCVLHARACACVCPLRVCTVPQKEELNASRSCVRVCALSLYVGQRDKSLYVSQKDKSLYVGQRDKSLYVSQKDKSLYVGQRDKSLYVSQSDKSLYASQSDKSLYVSQRDKSLYVSQRDKSLYVGQRDKAHVCTYACMKRQIWRCRPLRPVGCALYNKWLCLAKWMCPLGMSLIRDIPTGCALLGCP